MSKQLKQVINLSKKTGDRIIVFDNSEPDDSFVVMTLNQYENLIEKDNISNNKNRVLTENKIIDKIESTKSEDSEKKDNSWKIPSDVKEESE